MNDSSKNQFMCAVIAFACPSWEMLCPLWKQCNWPIITIVNHHHHSTFWSKITTTWLFEYTHWEISCEKWPPSFTWPGWANSIASVEWFSQWVDWAGGTIGEISMHQNYDFCDEYRDVYLYWIILNMDRCLYKCAAGEPVSFNIDQISFRHFETSSLYLSTKME